MTVEPDAVEGVGAAPTATAGYEGVWREPAEESTDLYPGAVVHDNRVTGSITFGKSRVPMWCVTGEYAEGGWDGVEDCWELSELGWTGDDFSLFLYRLLEMRGEFGRLLLMLANAERLEGENDEAWSDANIVVEDGVGRAKPDAEPEPGPWWAQRDIRGPVLGQLRRCVAALEAIDAAV